MIKKIPQREMSSLRRLLSQVIMPPPSGPATWFHPSSLAHRAPSSPTPMPTCSYSLRPCRIALSLSQYVRHVERYPHTLLPRFMGAHRLIVPEIGKVHFVVFSNVFSTDRVIHERYDLKGSTLGRTVGAEALARKTDVLRKDLDLKRRFHLGSNKGALLAQIRADVQFLREVRSQSMD